MPGLVPSSGTGTTYVGLRYLPTNAEATAPGCLCEGWGVADATSGVTGYADVSVGGVANLAVESFRRTSDTAVSVVRVGDTFRVTHDYHPSISPNLFEATVTIENISGQATDVRYRRVMDWDIEPTAFSEFVSVVTIAGTQLARNVLFSSDNGFASPNPLAGPSSIDFTGDAIDSGPDDHGALFDFGFGTLNPGEKVTFNIYYGAAATEAAADKALGEVKAEVYSYGQPNCPSFSCPDVNGPRDGRPNTFIFAFSGVGGESIKPPDTDADGVLDELDNCPFTKNAGQADANLDGIGDACTTPKLQHSTAGFLQAVLDGTTTVEPTSVLLGDEPSLTERVVRIVRFRLDAGLATDAAVLTANLVGSLVDSGLVSPAGSDAFIAGVLAQLDSTPPVVNVTFPAPDGKNGWFVHSPVTGTVTGERPGQRHCDRLHRRDRGHDLGDRNDERERADHRLGRRHPRGQLHGHRRCREHRGRLRLERHGNAEDRHDCAGGHLLGEPEFALAAEPQARRRHDEGLGDRRALRFRRVRATSAKSSEPDKGHGDGDTANDIQGWTIGTADTQGFLRAERSGDGHGRTYTLTYKGTDGAGNSATCATTVRVAHDQAQHDEEQRDHGHDDEGHDKGH